jgi:non-canonical (house-cleaning) NTP pyrophosphatase
MPIGISAHSIIRSVLHLLFIKDQRRHLQTSNLLEATMSSDGGTEDGSKKKKVELKIAVGSKNPCKIDAVKNALQRAVGFSSVLDVTLEVEGFDVDSGVADQPFGDAETQLGAKRRAENAHKAYKKKHGVFPHLGVGLEGGLERSSTILDDKDDETVWCMAWMAVYGRRQPLIVDIVASKNSEFYVGDKKPIYGLAKTATFLLPQALAKMITKEGMELGDADDKLFGRTKGKHGSGTVGILTDNLITRADYYEHALILALVPWLRPDVYALGADLASSLLCSVS